MAQRKSPTSDSLLKQVLDQEAHLSSTSTRFSKEVRTLQTNFLGRLQSFMSDPKSIGKGARFDLSVATKVVSEMNQILKDAGLDELVTGYMAEFPKVAENALSYFDLIGETPEFAGLSEDTLRAYIHYTGDQLSKAVDRSLLDPLRTAIFQGTFGDLDRRDVVSEVMRIGTELPVHQVEVAVDDSFRQFQRAVTVEGAAELELDIAWYTGAPPDAIISPQCEYILTHEEHGAPGMWYKDEISVSMVPGIKLRQDPLIAGGHPRCRHKFVFVTQEFAQEQGFEPR